MDLSQTLSVPRPLRKRSVPKDDDEDDCHNSKLLKYDEIPCSQKHLPDLDSDLTFDEPKSSKPKMSLPTKLLKLHEIVNSQKHLPDPELLPPYEELKSSKSKVTRKTPKDIRKSKDKQFRLCVLENGFSIGKLYQKGIYISFESLPLLLKRLKMLNDVELKNIEIHPWLNIHRHGAKIEIVSDDVTKLEFYEADLPDITQLIEQMIEKPEFVDM